MNTLSTILAVASASGHAARAILRISGPDAAVLVESHLEKWPGMTRGLHADRVTLGDMTCPVQVFRMPAPGSYTGEDVIEIQIPGHPMLAHELIRRFIESGQARGLAIHLASPGEFTFRAWRHGRLPLDRAEAVASLIAAESEEALIAARAAFDGGHGHALIPITEALAQLLALVEAGIDFADEEDVTVMTSDAVSRESARLAGLVEAHVNATKGMERESGRPRVVLRGPANAGKSTLFNALLGQTRVVMDSVAGTTRDAIVESVTFGGVDVCLVDTPGDEARSSLVATEAESSADFIVWCDPQGGGPPLTMHVQTKRDLSPQAPHPPAAVSAWSKEDVASLKIAIAEEVANRSSSAARVASSERQRALLHDAMRDLRAVESMCTDPSGHQAVERPAEVAALMRAALDSLGGVTGEVPPDDVLGLVFSGFCIGK